MAEDVWGVHLVVSGRCALGSRNSRRHQRNVCSVVVECCTFTSGMACGGPAHTLRQRCASGIVGSSTRSGHAICKGRTISSLVRWIEVAIDVVGCCFPHHYLYANIKPSVDRQNNQTVCAQQVNNRHSHLSLFRRYAPQRHDDSFQSNDALCAIPVCGLMYE